MDKRVQITGYTYEEVERRAVDLEKRGYERITEIKPFPQSAERTYTHSKKIGIVMVKRADQNG